MTTLREAALQKVRKRKAADTELTWPSLKYERDIVGFARDIIGARTWSKQRDALNLMASNKRVAIRAGHKVSKSHSVVIRILHFFCTYSDAQVYVTAPTFSQVKDVIWRELRKMHRDSGTCLACRDAGVKLPCAHSAKVDGKPAIQPSTGLSVGDRLVKGFSVDDANSISGRGGPHMLWIIDESVGVSDDIWEAIGGSVAGGAWLIVIGNPTEPKGEFYEAFHSKSKLYASMRISSKDSPNVTGECNIPGLATPEWIEEKRQEWGEDSPAFQTRVEGNFATRTVEMMISPEEIAESVRRGERSTALDGSLTIGIDCAGDAMGNDSWTFVPRRGKRIVRIDKVAGFDESAAIDKLHELLIELRQPSETVAVVFDGSSWMGKQFSIALSHYAAEHKGWVAPRRLMPHAASPDVRFFRLRDFLLSRMVDHIKKDLALPYDPDLEEELLALKWDLDKSDSAGLDKVIDKKVLRRLLGRSPDEADGVSYACFGMDRESDVNVSVDRAKRESMQRVRERRGRMSESLGFNAGGFGSRGFGGGFGSR